MNNRPAEENANASSSVGDITGDSSFEVEKQPEMAQQPQELPPEEGFRGWLCVLGAFFCLICSFGFLNAYVPSEDRQHVLTSAQYRSISDNISRDLPERLYTIGDRVDFCSSAGTSLRSRTTLRSPDRYLWTWSCSLSWSIPLCIQSLHDKFVNKILPDLPGAGTCIWHWSWCCLYSKHSLCRTVVCSAKRIGHWYCHIWR